MSFVLLVLFSAALFALLVIVIAGPGSLSAAILRRTASDPSMLAWVTAIVFGSDILTYFGIQGNIARITSNAITVLFLIIFGRACFPVISFCVGVLMNGTAVVVNGLHMPVVGHGLTLNGVTHVPAGSSTRLFALCDIFPIYIQRECVAVCSIGDILIAIGIFTCGLCVWQRILNGRNSAVIA